MKKKIAIIATIFTIGLAAAQAQAGVKEMVAAAALKQALGSPGVTNSLQAAGDALAKKVDPYQTRTGSVDYTATGRFGNIDVQDGATVTAGGLRIQNSRTQNVTIEDRIEAGDLTAGPNSAARLGGTRISNANINGGLTVNTDIRLRNMTLGRDAQVNLFGVDIE
ncbi:MAG: hypothetical protein A2521_09530 [Deltaproteobacteria bacterium RIFOXYD12_FULL_57_12]|nr:MAG: hypothetical protein A2521_09530 [Deltaproteobacteria bacterium RIFOXYD12_FULL_57_12]